MPQQRQRKPKSRAAPTSAASWFKVRDNRCLLFSTAETRWHYMPLAETGICGRSVNCKHVLYSLIFWEETLNSRSQHEALPFSTRSIVRTCCSMRSRPMTSIFEKTGQNNVICGAPSCALGCRVITAARGAPSRGRSHPPLPGGGGPVPTGHTARPRQRPARPCACPLC